MAKKHFGKMIALAAAAGAAFGCISYLLKYKSFHKELDEDFHDFEDDEFEEDLDELNKETSSASRNYVPLKSESHTNKESDDTDSDSDSKNEDVLKAMTDASEPTIEIQEDNDDKIEIESDDADVDMEDLN